MAVKTPMVPKQDSVSEPLSPPKEAMKQTQEVTIAMTRRVRLRPAKGSE